MTYPTFTTGDEILNLLDNRFNMPKPANPSKQQMQKFTSSRLFPIHLRIINLLKSWVTTYPEDFVNDDTLQSKFNTLITSWAEKSSKLQSTFESVKKVFEKKVFLHFYSPHRFPNTVFTLSSPSLNRLMSHFLPLNADLLDFYMEKRNQRNNKPTTRIKLSWISMMILLLNKYL